MAKKFFHRQGSLDGLCGHYAIINALTECCELTWKQQQKLLLLIWDQHKELYDGSSFHDMRRILSKIQNSQIWPKAITIGAPFKHASAKRDRDRYIDQLFSEKTARCALVQVQRYSDDWDEHWIVLVRGRNRLRFIDSVVQDGDTVLAKNRSSLQIGIQTNKRSTSSTWHLIRPREVFVFRSQMDRASQ